MPIYGADRAPFFTFQNSFGTIADTTNSAQSIPALSDSISIKRGVNFQKALKGSYDEPQNYAGMSEVSGELAIEANPISMGYMLGAFFGTAVVTTSDDLRTHSWQPKTAAFDSTIGSSWKRPCTYSVVGKFGGTSGNYYNLVANTLNIGIANGELLKMTCGFIGGRDDGDAFSKSHAFPTEAPFTWDASSISIDNLGAVSEIKELTINLEDPVEPKYYLDGGFWPGKNVLTGQRKVSVSGSLLYDTNSFYQAFKNKDELDFDITFQDATEIQSGYYNKFNMILRRVRIETAEANRTGPGEVMLSFNGNAHYDTADAEIAIFTLTNTKSAY